MRGAKPLETKVGCLVATIHPLSPAKTLLAPEVLKDEMNLKISCESICPTNALRLYFLPPRAQTGDQATPWPFGVAASIQPAR